jgi:hypothetical protein
MLFILSTRHLVDSTNHEMAIPTPGGAVAPHGDPHILKPAAHREVFEALRHRQAKEREIRQKWLDSVRKDCVSARGIRSPKPILSEDRPFALPPHRRGGWLGLPSSMRSV